MSALKENILINFMSS